MKLSSPDWRIVGLIVSMVISTVVAAITISNFKNSYLIVTVANESTL